MRKGHRAAQIASEVERHLAEQPVDSLGERRNYPDQRLRICEKLTGARRSRAVLATERLDDTARRAEQVPKTIGEDSEVGLPQSIRPVADDADSEDEARFGRAAASSR